MPQNASGVASVGASSTGTATADSFSSYNTNTWPGDTGSSYNPGAYDVNSMYNNYAQTYEQYYMSQDQVLLSTTAAVLSVLLHLFFVE